MTEGAYLAGSRLNGQGSDTQEKNFSSTLIAVFPNKCTTQSSMKCVGSRKPEQLFVFPMGALVHQHFFFKVFLSALVQREVFNPNPRH